MCSRVYDVTTSILIEARESELWKMEEKHLQERHQVSKQQIKDQFHLQRQQLVLRHDKVRARFFYLLTDLMMMLRRKNKC